LICWGIQGREDRLRREDEPERHRSPLRSELAQRNSIAAAKADLGCEAGMTDNGLPIGIQLAGPHWKEANLLRAAYAYEQNSRWTNLSLFLDLH